MRAAFATLAFAALAAAVPQAVTSAITPSTSPPPGCSEDYNGSFVITPVDTNSSSLQERNTPLTITLKGGILTDSEGRTGYVASNQQFQFDKPPQAGAIYTAGFSICPNGRLAIGNDETWFKCLSGTFFNLYLHNDAGQCSEIWLQVTGVNGGSPASATSLATITSSAGVNASAPIATMSTASGAMNGTMSASGGGNVTMTRTTGTASASGAGQTTSGTELQTGGPTSAQSAASAASSGSSGSSSSSTGGAVALPTARGDVLGFAAGLLAMAML